MSTPIPSRAMPGPVAAPEARREAPAAFTPAAPRSRLAQDWAVISVLWKRDLVRFFRERSRVVGAFLQPLIFWIVIGSGMGGTFRLGQIGYLEYFFPGVITMVALFTSIFATMSVIEDRGRGFLQGVLASPGSRTALVLGKCAGATTVALVQAGLFLLLAPLAGFPFAQIDWGSVAPALLLVSLGLTATGFAVAWWLDSTQGYHVVMSLVLLPLWILSGAMFPASNVPWIRGVMRYNPMAYAVSAIRRGLYGHALPHGAAIVGASAVVDLIVLGAFAGIGVALAVTVCGRKA